MLDIGKNFIVFLLNNEISIDICSLSKCDR